jgi:hypothetical protein
MQMVKIRFPSRQDEAKGIGRLVRRFRVICLPEGEFEVPTTSLAVLDELGVDYEILAREGFDHALKALRDVAAAQIQ